MKLHHISFWTKDINTLVEFYKKHFNGEVLFSHQAGDFKCTFIKIYSSFNLEIMTCSDPADSKLDEKVGYSHLSIEVESKKEVDEITDYFLSQKVSLEKIKEQYDDGFYESSVADPDGNIIEIAFIDRNVNNAV